MERIIVKKLQLPKAVLIPDDPIFKYVIGLKWKKYKETDWEFIPHYVLRDEYEKIFDWPCFNSVIFEEDLEGDIYEKN